MPLKPQSRELLEALPRSPFGNALKDLLEDYKERLNKVQTIKTHEETLGRALALDLIDEIFSFYTEKTTPNKKNNYS